MKTSKRYDNKLTAYTPSKERILATGFVKLCTVCRREWEASEVTLEDGIEKCPDCLDGSEQERLQTLAEETAYAASREPMPQVSQAPLTTTFPGTIVKMEDATGARVYSGSPMALYRTVLKQLVLKGRSFTASDTITGNANLTIAVASRTATQTTLNLTAGAGMTPGAYGLTFNDVDFNNILSVR